MVEGESPHTVDYCTEKLGNFLRYAEEYGLPQVAEDSTTQHMREFLVTDQRLKWLA